MKCCNDCGPLKGGPIGPSCPEPEPEDTEQDEEESD